MPGLCLPHMLQVFSFTLHTLKGANVVQMPH
jgi:hypothetical protein